MIVKKVNKASVIEISGDDSKRTFRIWGPIMDVEDTQGEFTPPTAVKDKMDWFINELGGPMTVNHTKKVVARARDYGIDIHPKHGKPALWLGGEVLRGPDGSPFPSADRVWKAFKENKVKGSSWAADILKEVKETDLNSFKEKVTNEDILPFSWGIVMDDGHNYADPALPDSTVIDINDKAKSVDEMEDIEMTDETKEVVETSEPEKEKTDVPQYMTVEQFKESLEKFKTDLMGILAPPPAPEPVKEKEADPEEKEEKDPEEKEEDEDKEKEVMAKLDAKIKECEEKEKSLQSLIDKVGVPQPKSKESMDKEKTGDVDKKVDLSKMKTMTHEQRIRYLSDKE